MTCTAELPMQLTEVAEAALRRRRRTPATSRLSSASWCRPQRGPGTTKRRRSAVGHLQNGIDEGHVKTLEARQHPAAGHISRRLDDGSAYVECVPGVSVNGMGGAIT